MILRLALLAIALTGCDVVFGVQKVTPTVDASSSCFVDGFDGTVDSTHWDFLSPGDPVVMISEENHGLVARIAPGGTGYNGLVGKVPLDLVDGSVQVAVMPAYVGGFVETVFAVDASAQAHFTMSVGAYNLNLKSVINNQTMTKMVSYDAATMIYWRIAHHSATSSFAFETSADATIWSEQYSVPLTYIPTAALIELTAGEYNAGLPQATTARFEQLRVIGPGCP